MDDSEFTYVGLIGAGGQADETEMYLVENGQRVIFRAVDTTYISNVDDSSIAIEDADTLTPVIIAIGAPGARKRIFEKWSGNRYATAISKQAVVGKSSIIAQGCILAPGAILTTNITVGSHTLINTGVTIGHDTIIGQFVTVSPGVHVGGKVEIGDGVFIGLGAAIKNGISVAGGVVIGAGAVVLQDITDENAIYVGVPARKIGQNDEWLEKI